MSPYTEARLYRDAGAVKRYHTTRTHRAQSVAEHSFGMLMLIKQVLPHDWSADRVERLYNAVLHHDLPEFYTGDIPGPIKRAHPALGPLMDAIEAELAPLHHDFELLPDEEVLLKWADRMEGALWSMEELRMGNLYLRGFVGRYLGWAKHARILPFCQALTDEIVQIALDEFGIHPESGAQLEMKI